MFFDLMMENKKRNNWKDLQFVHNEKMYEYLPIAEIRDLLFLIKKEVTKVYLKEKWVDGIHYESWIS